VERLLELARPARMSFAQVRLPELLDRAIELYADQLDERRIVIGREYARDVPSIQADREALYRVFVNLIANALDAMPDGGRLIVRTGWTASRDPLPLTRRRSANRVKIEVEDTGDGIEASETNRVFNPFYTTRDHGTGLGLALAHKVVQDHSGVISFRSTPGRGTTFTIVLPLVPDREPDDEARR